MSSSLCAPFYEGYAGYYGLSLISGSYAVLFASLAAHAAQFAFLVFFENPRTLRLSLFLHTLLYHDLIGPFPFFDRY
jgi:hypothetical protein